MIAGILLATIKTLVIKAMSAQMAEMLIFELLRYLAAQTDSKVDDRILEEFEKSCGR